jgi:phage tail-like protein
VNSERTNQHYSPLPTPYSLSKSTINHQPSTITMLSVQLTPLSEPEAIPQKSHVGIRGIAVEEIRPDERRDLLVRPGERADMELLLHNTGTQDLVLNKIEVRGDFPPDWLRISSEGSSLTSSQKMAIGIYFLVPADFFEKQEVPVNFQGRQVLTLNYQCQINVFYQLAGSLESRKENVFFNVYIRPRSLYLNYVPEIYREVDFIGRLLKIFEQAFEPSVKVLETMFAYLDSLTAPSALLSFLAHWVGWQSIPGVDLSQQRRLIKNALKIYQTRGTREGLRFYLHLYTGLPLDENLPEFNKHISIEDTNIRGFVLGESYLGRDTFLGSGKPYHFIVKLKALPDSPLDENLIRLIIEQEKPAWTTYELRMEN